MSNVWELRHLFVTAFLSNIAVAMVNPVIPDVAVETVCGGEDECSLAIYLTGFQQVIMGLGSAVMMPLIGDLSDTYGRKNLLTVPLTLAIIPLVILAWKRTTSFFYTYYAFNTLFATITDAGVMCISFGYLADSVPEATRSAIFPMFFGIINVANICGNLTARLLSTPHILQVATVLSVVALVYMRLLLKDTNRVTETLEHPLLRPSNEINNGSSKIKDFIKHISLLGSTAFALAALVAFFNAIAEDGSNSILMYYLKARFHFNKDQFAIIFLIVNAGAAVTNVFFMPVLAPIVGEDILLPFGLFCGFLSMTLQSIAWSPWVPYVAASMGMFFLVTTPCIRSIVSKLAGCDQQGIAQGCVSGISSLAYVISPLIFSPLSALFLSNHAPFPFPGFCILCIGFAYLIGFILSLIMKMMMIQRDGKTNVDWIVDHQRPEPIC